MPKKPGPKPETLKIEGDYRDAIKTALSKKRPAGGWPKPPKPAKGK
jgi:hypothetical protein